MSHEGNNGRRCEGNNGRRCEGNNGRRCEGNNARSSAGRDGRSDEPGDERGSASIWVVGACLILASLTVVSVLFGAAIFARHRAEAAADLAALAGANRIGVDGEICAASARIAAANGAELISCTSELSVDGRSGEVTVRVRIRVQLAGVGTGSVSASARAGRLPIS